MTDPVYGAHSGTRPPSHWPPNARVKSFTLKEDCCKQSLVNTCLVCSRLRAYSPALKKNPISQMSTLSHRLSWQKPESPCLRILFSGPWPRNSLPRLHQAQGLAPCPLFCPLRLQHRLFWNLFRSYFVPTHPKMQTRGALRSLLAPQGQEQGTQ